ncbi:flavodoxin [Streptomyces phaeofaciens]
MWNVRALMIMTTFTEQYDFTGKTVIPFITHAMSSLGTTEHDYAASCTGARFAEGLAVRGEEVNQADRTSKPGCSTSVWSLVPSDFGVTGQQRSLRRPRAPDRPMPGTGPARMNQ